jgi:hypothetical protein
MITAEQEQGRSGPGEEFLDSVSIDFCDPGNGLYGLAWIVDRPNAGRSSASAVVFIDGSAAERLEVEQDEAVRGWDEVAVGPLRMRTETPLERWSLDLLVGDASLRLDATAVSRPTALANPALADAAGIDQYEQLCSCTGSLEHLGKSREIRAVGRRVHCWGEFAWDRVRRWRTLYAASAEGRAVSVSTALPPGDGHGDELRTATLLGDDDPQQFDDVRVSTVFGADGLPAKAGLELWPSGEDVPRRLSGEAVCGASITRDGHELSLSFFRWSMEGVPAFGCYELVERR